MSGKSNEQKTFMDIFKDPIALDEFLQSQCKMKMKDEQFDDSEYNIKSESSSYDNEKYQDETYNESPNCNSLPKVEQPLFFMQQNVNINNNTEQSNSDHHSRISPTSIKSNNIMQNNTSAPNNTTVLSQMIGAQTNINVIVNQTIFDRNNQQAASNNKELARQHCNDTRGVNRHTINKRIDTPTSMQQLALETSAHKRRNRAANITLQHLISQNGSTNIVVPSTNKRPKSRKATINSFPTNYNYMDNLQLMNRQQIADVVSSGLNQATELSHSKQSMQALENLTGSTKFLDSSLSNQLNISNNEQQPLQKQRSSSDISLDLLWPLLQQQSTRPTALLNGQQVVLLRPQQLKQHSDYQQKTLPEVTKKIQEYQQNRQRISQTQQNFLQQNRIQLSPQQQTFLQHNFLQQNQPQHNILQHNLSQQTLAQQNQSQQNLQQSISQQSLLQQTLSQQNLLQQKLSQNLLHHNISQTLTQPNLSQQSQQILSQQNRSHQNLSQHSQNLSNHAQQNLSQHSQNLSQHLQQNLSQQNLSQHSQQNLSQQNLSQQNLSQQNLSQQNLSQQNLSQQNLSQQNLSQQNLSQQNLSQQNLSQHSQNLPQTFFQPNFSPQQSLQQNLYQYLPQQNLFEQESKPKHYLPQNQSQILPHNLLQNNRMSQLQGLSQHQNVSHQRHQNLVQLRQLPRQQFAQQQLKQPSQHILQHSKNDYGQQNYLPNLTQNFVKEQNFSDNFLQSSQSNCSQQQSNYLQSNLGLQQHSSHSQQPSAMSNQCSQQNFHLPIKNGIQQNILNQNINHPYLTHNLKQEQLNSSVYEDRKSLIEQRILHEMRSQSLKNQTKSKRSIQQSTIEVSPQYSKSSIIDNSENQSSVSTNLIQNNFESKLVTNRSISESQQQLLESVDIEILKRPGLLSKHISNKYLSSITNEAQHQSFKSFDLQNSHKFKEGNLQSSIEKSPIEIQREHHKEMIYKLKMKEEDRMLTIEREKTVMLERQKELEKRVERDKFLFENPDVNTPFKDFHDICERLSPFFTISDANEDIKRTDFTLIQTTEIASKINALTCRFNRVLHNQTNRSNMPVHTDSIFIAKLQIDLERDNLKEAKLLRIFPKTILKLHGRPDPLPVGCRFHVDVIEKPNRSKDLTRHIESVKLNVTSEKWYESNHCTPLLDDLKGFPPLF